MNVEEINAEAAEVILRLLQVHERLLAKYGLFAQRMKTLEQRIKELEEPKNGEKVRTNTNTKSS